MLQPLSKESQFALDLADYIEHPEIVFCMGHWHTCICGHALTLAYSQRSLSSVPVDVSSRVIEGAELLGLRRDVACALFNSHAYTKEEAVRLLRHLAVTGEILDYETLKAQGPKEPTTQPNPNPAPDPEEEEEEEDGQSGDFNPDEFEEEETDRILEEVTS